MCCARKMAGNKSGDQRDLVTISETYRARLGPSCGAYRHQSGDDGSSILRPSPSTPKLSSVAAVRANKLSRAANVVMTKDIEP